jgi:hypothetical protein
MRQVRNGDYRAAVTAIRAEGTTNFSAAFAETERLIRHHSGIKNVVVVLMTDGQDSNGADKASKACGAMSAALRKPGHQSIVFHTLGFSKEHNFALLDNIRTAGTQAGYFRYAEPGDGIDVLTSKFGEIFDVAVNSTATVPVQLVCPGLVPIAGGAFPTAVDCDDTGMCSFTCWVRASGAGGPTPTIAVTVEGSRMEVPLVRRPQTHGAGVWRVLVCEAQLERLAVDIAEAAKTGKLSAATHGTALARLTDQLKAVAIFGQKGLGKAAREEIIAARAELQERLDAMQRVVASAATAAATADKTSLIARAADIAYQANFTKARRQRAIDRRIVSNTTSALSVEEQLAALHAARPAGSPVTAMSQEALDFYFCTLTQCHVADLMEADAAEVLGFGLAVQRPEAVVDCPTLLNVHAISTTLCSRSTMHDAIRFAISVEGHVRTHGGLGWQAELGVALRGRSREPINAWMPLYISK